VLAAFITTLFFSVSGICAARTSRMLGGTEANFWRILLAAVFLAVLANLTGVGLGGPSFKIFLLSGVVGFGVGDLALYEAFPRIGSRLSIMLVHCLAAPFAAVVEWLWLGTRIHAVEAVCVGIILVGVGVALAPKEHLHVKRAVLVTGVALGIFAAMGQGMGAVLSRKAYDVTHDVGFQMDGISAAYQRILGGLPVAVAGMLWMKSRRWEAAPEKNWKRILPWLVGNAAMGPALGVACYQWALGTAPTAIVLPIVALTPLAMIPLSWKMEGERPSARSIAGSVVAVGGVIGLTLARQKFK
jgi:drug/metabolite transporter (DMT)-like permease